MTTSAFCHFESQGLSRCAQQCKQCGESNGKAPVNPPAPGAIQIEAVIDAIRAVCADRDRALEQNKEIIATLEAALMKARKS